MLTLWCLFGSPLMIGGELTKLDKDTLALLTNQEVLDMLTPECKPGQLALDEEKAIWSACNENSGAVYVALFNLKDEAAEVTADLAKSNVSARAVWKELWTGEKRSVRGSVLAVPLPEHGCAVFGSQR